MNSTDRSTAGREPTYQQLAEAEIRGIIADREKLAVEYLIADDERNLTVEQHLAFQRSIATERRAFDEIDEAAADPIHDHIPQARSHGKASRVLNILDELDQQSNRRFNA